MLRTSLRTTVNPGLRGVNPLANTRWIDDSDTILNTKTIVLIILPVSTDTPNPLLGGFGFRDIQLFNQAQLAKISRRIIITKPDCLLARTLLGKYCHNISFLKATKPSISSHGWKGILYGRDLLTQHLGKAIGDGETTKVWSDSIRGSTLHLI
ncbi:unnamed protein product [Brassica oleracea]|uniref:(rape) hypothetical protein n=1 Tax=Brassica napus TaxID=3708 RepID=A0A816K584_BRANA|nr:unnamed protein product [Brassica napus]